MDRIFARCWARADSRHGQCLQLQETIAHFVGHRGYSDQILESVKKRWTIDDTPNLRRMYDTGKPVVITDVTKGADWVDTPTPMDTLLRGPILHDGQVKGFINLDSGTRGRYQPVDGERLRVCQPGRDCSGQCAVVC
ncbi:MAG: GAF domain-containing protein [Chloroflexi bacterium]|nr:GAF domain-containing protein [Chloroflexota bacterium]